MVRLFQTELEHYEKIEGIDAVDGRQGQPARRADPRQPRRWPCRASPSCRCSPASTCTPAQGRIFSYDVTGGRYEETAFHSVGSGSLFARGSLKKLYRDDLDRRASASTAVVQALYDAADDDSATGGPDLTRRIFPVVQVITAEGGRRLPDAEVAAVADRVIAGPDEPPRRPGRRPDLSEDPAT